MGGPGEEQGWGMAFTGVVSEALSLCALSLKSATRC